MLEQSPIEMHKPPSLERLLRDQIEISPSPGKEMPEERLTNVMKDMFFNLGKVTFAMSQEMVLEQSITFVLTLS